MVDDVGEECFVSVRVEVIGVVCEEGDGDVAACERCLVGCIVDVEGGVGNDCEVLVDEAVRGLDCHVFFVVCCRACFDDCDGLVEFVEQVGVAVDLEC